MSNYLAIDRPMLGRCRSASLRDEFEKFAAKIDVSGGSDACWPWMGSRKASGYGTFYPIGNAHRAAWILFRGWLPSMEIDGAKHVIVCHACDNPPCVNPGHLFLGTQRHNVEDYWNKVRSGDLTRKPWTRRATGSAS